MRTTHGADNESVERLVPESEGPNMSPALAGTRGPGGRRVSVRALLLCVAGGAVVATVALSGLLYWGFQYRVATNSRVDADVKNITLLHDIQTSMLSQGGFLATYYIIPDPAYAQSFRDDRASADTAFAELAAAIEGQDKARADRVAELRIQYAQLADWEEQTLAALERGDRESAIALATGPASLEQSSPALQAALDELIRSEQDRLAAAQRADHRAQLVTLLIATIIVAFSGALVVAIGAATLTWLVRPLERASRAARLIASGDLSIRVKPSGPLELAQLSTEVNRMAEALIGHSDDLNDRLTAEIRVRTRMSAFGADVDSTRAGADNLPEMLDACTIAMVRNLDAALAAIWTLDPVTDLLELRSSSNVNTDLARTQGSILVGNSQIDAIAASRRAEITNDATKEGFADPAWARREGIVAFAAYPLIVNDECLGVVAAFARHPLAAAALDALDAVSRDIAMGIVRLREAEAKRESEERLRLISESASVGIYQLGRHQQIIYLNAAACAMFEVKDEQEAEAQEFERFFTEESLETMRAEYAKRARGITSSYEIEVIGLLGTRRHVLVSGSVLHDDNGEPDSVIGTMIDITDRKQQEEALRHAASHDPLTDVFNRRQFQQAVDEFLSRPASDAFGAVILLDIDDFKAVNDTFGHPVGDHLLIEIARTLKARLRDGDVLARLGGDEFAIFMSRTDLRGARRRANSTLVRLQRNIASIDGRPIQCFASVGVAVSPAHGATADELLAHADLAMYEAKDRGRNRVCTYSQRDATGEAAGRLDSKRRIRDAIEQDRLRLYCQPVVNLRSSEVEKYELLLRMLDERGRVLLPGSFLGIAEEYGLISDIDRWVVRSAMDLVAAQRRLGRQISVNVNLSGKAFDDASVLHLVKRELTRTGNDPASICFEVTESAAIADLDRAVKLLSHLALLGFRLSIDDFGVGFSSFSHLKHLPVNELKIDGSFIQNLRNSTVDQHLVRGMVEMARGLGMKVVAEFVQDAESVELLREYGVDYGQGYFFGKPFPVEELGERQHPREERRAA